MDDMKEYLLIAVAAASLIDKRSGTIRATTEEVDARARELKYKVKDVLRERGDTEALYQ
jgi:hypothetical protein